MRRVLLQNLCPLRVCILMRRAENKQIDKHYRSGSDVYGGKENRVRTKQAPECSCESSVSLMR